MSKIEFLVPVSTTSLTPHSTPGMWTHYDLKGREFGSIYQTITHAEMVEHTAEFDHFEAMDLADPEDRDYDGEEAFADQERFYAGL